jgi:hypothetical protein
MSFLNPLKEDIELAQKVLMVGSYTNRRYLQLSLEETLAYAT